MRITPHCRLVVIDATASVGGQYGVEQDLSASVAVVCSNRFATNHAPAHRRQVYPAPNPSSRPTESALGIAPTAYPTPIDAKLVRPFREMY